MIRLNFFTPFQKEIIALSLIKNFDLQKLNIKPELDLKTTEIGQKFDELMAKDEELDKAIEEIENLPRRRVALVKLRES